MTAFGSAPHHDRVLIVVLVMPEGDSGASSANDRTARIAAHTAEVWRIAFDLAKGHEKPPEAPAADECVQPVCPTCHGFGVIPVRLARNAVMDPRPIWQVVAEDGPIPRERQPAYGQVPCPDCVALARQLLIERLGPLPEPIPEEGL